MGQISGHGGRGRTFGVRLCFPDRSLERCRDAAETAFYCATGDYAAFDSVRLGPELYQQIGDNAVGMLLGGLFAQAAQQRRGQSATGRTGQLEVDCLAGSWTNDLLTGTSASEIQLSPGDLDEAVAALLIFNRANKGAQVSAFDRIAAYRQGTLQAYPDASERQLIQPLYPKLRWFYA